MSISPSELPPSIGIIGGSGLYDIEGITNTEELEISTPFGDPSDRLIVGELTGRRVVFLPRHGKGHRILPHELNHRANIYALRAQNVRWIISATAVGLFRQLQWAASRKNTPPEILSFPISSLIEPAAVNITAFLARVLPPTFSLVIRSVKTYGSFS